MKLRLRQFQCNFAAISTVTDWIMYSVIFFFLNSSALLFSTLVVLLANLKYHHHSIYLSNNLPLPFTLCKRPFMFRLKCISFENATRIRVNKRIRETHLTGTWNKMTLKLIELSMQEHKRCSAKQNGNSVSDAVCRVQKVILMKNSLLNLASWRVRENITAVTVACLCVDKFSLTRIPMKNSKKHFEKLSQWGSTR